MASWLVSGDLEDAAPRAQGGAGFGLLASGNLPLREIVPACDPFKPKAYWQELHNQFPDRVTTAVIDDASHALFPEQPDMVADAVLPWLARHREDRS
jgi:pimeloyl-ACP methyl ester carboxylesterase